VFYIIFVFVLCFNTLTDATDDREHSELVHQNTILAKTISLSDKRCVNDTNQPQCKFEYDFLNYILNEKLQNNFKNLKF